MSSLLAVFSLIAIQSTDLIVQRHAQMRGALVSIRIEEQEETARFEVVRLHDFRRAAREEHAEKALHAILDQARSGEATPEQLERIRSGMQERYDQVEAFHEALLAAAELPQIIHRTRIIDFNGRRVHHSDVDLNGEERRAAAGADVFEGFYSTELDASAERLSTPNGSFQRLGNLAWMRGDALGVDYEFILLGLLPETVTSRPADGLTQIRRSGGFVELTRLASDPVRPVFVAELDPAEDYRVRRLVDYDDQGQVVMTHELSDYRRVGGLSIPHATVRTVYLDGEPAQTWTRVVTDAKVNLDEWPAGAFEFPQLPDDGEREPSNP